MVAKREARVLLAVARLVVGVSVRAADEIGEASLVQLRALTVIDELGTANLMQLAERMGVTISTTSRLVDRLVAGDLVDRRPSEQTRREISIRLTDNGNALLRRYDELRVAELHARLAQLPAADHAGVLDALSVLAETSGSAGLEAAGRGRGHDQQRVDRTRA
jgi:DNA-binding MarR family transcriptional regulator